MVDLWDQMMATRLLIMMLPMGFQPLLNCHVMTAADTTSKVAASKHVYMYRSMMWYKRGRGECQVMDKIIKDDFIRGGGGM